MSDGTMGSKTERLTLRVSDAFLEGLDELSIKEGMTRSDLIRRAVALYSFAKEEERQGRKLGFFSEEDNRDVVKQVITL
jgi:metal-responsive CopG/Arc/MetJ family transcriptional regulator